MKRSPQHRSQCAHQLLGHMGPTPAKYIAPAKKRGNGFLRQISETHCAAAG